MRLTPRQVRLVKEAVSRHFGAQAHVWAFGSRVDDSRRGGDFDFYVETDLVDADEIFDRKLEPLAELHATSDFEGEKIRHPDQIRATRSLPAHLLHCAAGGYPPVRTIEELRAALNECEHHGTVLREARAEIGTNRFSAESVEQIASATLRLLDQSAYRFGKLQDRLGLRVLPAILDLSEEPLPESTPFAEKPQRLERLGAIPSAHEWRVLRELRNQLAHEYADAPALKAAALNRLVDGVDRLLAICQHLLDYSAKRGWSTAHARDVPPSARDKT
jgi:hypothetical protein